MENKINVAELLKDCPEGMELDCTIWDSEKVKVFLKRVSGDEFAYPIEVTVKYNNTECFRSFTKYGAYNDLPYCKCVIFPKGKTTWEGFVPPYKFKDGDITVSTTGGIHIMQNSTTSYCQFNRFGLLDKTRTSCVRVKRLATEEEKEKLFQAIKDNGYRWNEETKTLEELIQPEFKDGDVITCTNSACSFVAIFKEINTDTTFQRYVSLTLDDVPQFWAKETWADFKTPRLATEEEKQKLFQAIKDNGYRWDAETKTLEKLVAIFKVGDKIKLKNAYAKKYNDFNTREITEIQHSHYILDDKQAMPLSNQYLYKLVPDKFDINTLVPFESRVLVRTNHFHDTWIAGFFSHKDSDGFAPFWTTADKNYQQCIPYEGNEHLLGKTDDCDEHFKTWK